MDPITATVVWGVIWFFLAPLGGIVIYFVILGIGALIGGMFDDYEAGAAIALIPAWLALLAWEVFCIIQVVLHAINLFKILAGS